MIDAQFINETNGLPRAFDLGDSPETKRTMFGIGWLTAAKNNTKKLSEGLYQMPAPLASILVKEGGYVLSSWYLNSSSPSYSRRI